jgi:hypothetical protein
VGGRGCVLVVSSPSYYIASGNRVGVIVLL